MQWYDDSGEQREGDLTDWYSWLQQAKSEAELNQLDRRALALDPALDLGGASKEPPEAVASGRVVA